MQSPDHHIIFKFVENQIDGFEMVQIDKNTIDKPLVQKEFLYIMNKQNEIHHLIYIDVYYTVEYFNLKSNCLSHQYALMKRYDICYKYQGQEYIIKSYYKYYYKVMKMMPKVDLEDLNMYLYHPHRIQKILEKYEDIDISLYNM
jgi:hypothetical protein